MYCETAKVRRVASMFKYYRKDPPLRLCGVLMSPPDWAEKKVEFLFQDLYGPLYYIGWLSIGFDMRQFLPEY